MVSVYALAVLGYAPSEVSDEANVVLSALGSRSFR